MGFVFNSDTSFTDTVKYFQHQISKKPRFVFLTPFFYLCHPFSQVSVPIVVQHNVTVNSEDKFPEKLWYLVDRPAFNDVIHWSPDGTAIVMYDELFVLKILKRQHDKIFKTESLKSFVRQLNLYGFRKVQSDRESMGNDLEVVSLYEHEYFVRGRPELLSKFLSQSYFKISLT